MRAYLHPDQVIYDAPILNHPDLLKSIADNSNLTYSKIIDKLFGCDNGLMELACGGDLSLINDILLE